jgi:hypothetical protein
MQEDRRHDEGLVQRFKRVLGDMGIQIEVDEEGEGVEVTTNLDKTRDASRSGAVAALGRHSRRSRLWRAASALSKWLGLEQPPREVRYRSTVISAGATAHPSPGEW